MAHTVFARISFRPFSAQILVMDWIGVKGEFWPYRPPLLLYPLLHVKAEYLFTTVIVDSPNIKNNIGVGVLDAKTNERCIDSLIHEFTVISCSFIRTMVQIINNARYMRFTSRITLCCIIELSVRLYVNIILVVFASAGLCADIADFRTSR